MYIYIYNVLADFVILILSLLLFAVKNILNNIL